MQHFIYDFFFVRRISVLLIGNLQVLDVIQQIQVIILLLRQLFLILLMLTLLFFLSRNIHNRCLSNDSFSFLALIQHTWNSHCLLHQYIFSGGLMKDAREIVYSNLVVVIQSFLVKVVVFIGELSSLDWSKHVLKSWQVLLIHRGCSSHDLGNIFNDNSFFYLNFLLMTSIYLSFLLFLLSTACNWRF